MEQFIKLECAASFFGHYFTVILSLNEILKFVILEVS